MTPAQAALLRKLRDEGPQVRTLADEDVSFELWRDDLLYSAHPDLRIDRITPAGLAALAEHEKGSSAPKQHRGNSDDR